MKTYTAQTGYVWHYYYLGQRRASRGARQATEYVFDLSRDRREWHPVSILLGDAELAFHEARLGHALIPAERYAIAKLTLFQAFDDGGAAGTLRVRAADLRAILETLGIEERAP